MKKSAFILILLLLGVSITKAKKEQKIEPTLVLKGDSCMNEHDSYHAITYYQQYIDEHPKDLNVLKKLASCYRMRGDNKKCIACMDSIPTDSLNHDDLRMKFYSYLNLGDKGRVDLYGTKIIDDYPYDSELFATLLSHWNNQGKPEKVSTFAMPYVEKYDSTNILVNKELAYSLYLQFKYEQAIPRYKRLIADGFDNFESNLVLGLCFHNQEKYKEATPYLEKAYQLKDDNSNCLFYLGMNYKKMAEKTKDIVCEREFRSKAITYLNRSIEVAYPKSRALYINQQLAELYYKNFNYKEAGHSFAQCIEYDEEDNPLNYYNAAQMYIGAQMKPQAKLYLQIFLEKADKLKDEKEKAKLTSKVKEQLKNSY